MRAKVPGHRFRFNLRTVPVGVGFYDANPKFPNSFDLTAVGSKKTNIWPGTGEQLASVTVPVSFEATIPSLN
jgi:hypothetical protein